MSRAAVFLDRDGTVNHERGYCGDPDQVELLPGAAEAIARLHAAGRLLVVVTNQSGIARGYYGEHDLARVHARLAAALDHRVHAWLHCPHHPSEGAGPYTRRCDCRKPDTGMLRRAAELFDIDFGRSWLVGDAARDVQAGHRAGLRTCLVRCGKDPAAELATLRAAAVTPDLVCDDLAAALATLLDTSARTAHPSG